MPSVSSNNGNPTALTCIPEAVNQQAYFPHYYDVVLKTDLVGEADASRLGYIMLQLLQSRQLLNMPMMIGEWGAFYSWGDKVLQAAQTMTTLIDDALIGDFYWEYFPDLKKQSFFQKVLKRPYMMAAPGEIISQKVKENSFEVIWKEDKKINSPGLIFTPSQKGLKISGKTKSEFIPLNEEGSGILKIKPGKSGKTRKLIISWRESKE